MIHVTECADPAPLPRTELYGPITAGSFEEAMQRAQFYGLDGYWVRSNSTLYLVPKEAKDDLPNLQTRVL